MRSLNVALVLLVILVPSASSQARPAGKGRGWIEVGVGNVSQSADCSGCLSGPSQTGLAFSAATGGTLSERWGTAVAYHAFQEADGTSTSGQVGSRYIVVLGQFSPMPLITLNVGGGLGLYGAGERPNFPSDADGAATVVTGGVAARLPWRSRLALTATANAIQAATGVGRDRPRTFSVGIGLSLASGGDSAKAEPSSLRER